MKALFFILYISFVLSVANLPEAAAKTELKCPEVLSSLGAQAVPYKVYVTQGYQVLICVLENDLVKQAQPAELRKKHLFQFDAHLFKKDTYIKTLFSGNLKTPITFIRKNGVLFENMYLNILENYYPLYQSKVVCKFDNCEKDEKKCIFKQALMPAMSPKEFATEKAVLAKAEAGLEEISSGEMFEMLQVALRGREQGIKFFTKLEKLPKLAVNVLENYKSIQKLLEKMILDDCLAVGE